MQALSKEGSMLDQAKHHAKDIASLYGNNDKFQLLTQDFEGRHQRLLSRDEFLDAVDVIKISPQSRSLQQIVDRQTSLLKSQSTGGSIYLLSDFQKNMGGQKLKADTGINVNFVQLKANNLPNVAVDSAWLVSAIHRPDDNEKLVVRLHNYANQEAKSIPLRLTINNQQKALGSFTLAPRSVQNDTLAFSGLQAGWQQGELNLQDNPVTFDNRFFFTFNVKQQMPLLLVNGGTNNQYLNAVFATDRFFAVSNVQDGNVDYARLNNYPLVILSDIRAVSSGLSQQFQSYVKQGGRLVVFPASDADLANYKQLLQPLHAGYPEKLITAKTRVASINIKSNVFKNVFEQMPDHPDLPQVEKYHQLNNGAQAVTENLMQLQGGESFFSASKYGKGMVYVSAVALDEQFGNFPRHALLLPMMFRIALLSGKDQPLFYTIGQDDAIELPPLQLNDKQILKLSKGSLTIIPDARQQEGSTLLYVSDQIKETGNYVLKKQDSVVAQLAFNDNRKESDLTYLAPADLKNIAQKSNLVNGGVASVKSELSGVNLGTQLWKLCLILALIFIAAEILLVRYYKVPKTQQNAAV